MDNNQLYIKRLREVLWNKQKDLKKVVSHEFCPTCQEYILTSNYCQQCGQMNLSTDTITYHESQSFIDNGQYYMVQSNHWLDRWGLWLEEQLNKVGIQINQGTLFNLGTFHKVVTIIFTLANIYFQWILVRYFAWYGIYLDILFAAFSMLMIFVNYQLYRGKSQRVLIGLVGIFVCSIFRFFLAGSLSEEASILLLFIFPLVLLLIVTPNVSKSIGEMFINKGVELEQSKSPQVQAQNFTPNYNKSEKSFKYRHTGATILNWLLFGLPLLIAIFSAQSLSQYLSGFGIYVGDSIFAIILVAALLIFIYFLPAFICQSSGLKVALWVCLLVFGWTIIGWFILLFVATSSNSNRRRQQEMAYLMRKLADK